MRLQICLALLPLAAGTAVAKECRMPPVPPDVRIQTPPGCEAFQRDRRLDAEKQDHGRGGNGFVDLGNGTQVRVGGRVRAEFGTSR